MNWLQARLKERSTYIGAAISALAVAKLGPELGLPVGELAQKVLYALAGVGGAGVALTAEGGTEKKDA